MTQHLGTPPRPWVGLETHLQIVRDSPDPDTAPVQHNVRQDALRRRKLAALSLAMGYLARKRAGASPDAG